MKLFICTMLLMFSLISCEKEIKENSDFEQILLNAAQSENTAQLSDYFTIDEYIKIKSDGDYFIGGIGKLIVDKNNFYIYDEVKQVLIRTDARGNILTIFDRKGAGPEEFSEISDFCIIEDSIYIFDSSNKKVLKYFRDGTFITEFPLTSTWGGEIHSVGNKIYINHAYNNTLYNEDDRAGNYHISIYDSTLNLVDRAIPQTINAFSPYLISSRNYFSKNGDVLTTYEQYNSTFYHCHDGRVEPFIQFLPPSISNEELLKATSESGWDIEKTMNFEKSKPVFRVLSFQENDKFLYIMYQYKNNYHTILYNKNENKVDEYFDPNSPMSLVNDLDQAPYYPLLAANENYFYSFTEGGYLSEVIQDSLKLSDVENPVIVRLKTK